LQQRASNIRKRTRSKPCPEEFTSGVETHFDLC
jgi:hypothetical protein